MRTERSPGVATAARALFALLAFLMVSWPLISIAGGQGAFALFHYVFLVWSGLLLLLCLIGRAVGRGGDQDQ